VDRMSRRPPGKTPRLPPRWNRTAWPTPCREKSECHAVDCVLQSCYRRSPITCLQDRRRCRARRRRRSAPPQGQAGTTARRLRRRGRLQSASAPSTAFGRPAAWRWDS
jgi:hypothetical protein